MSERKFKVGDKVRIRGYEDDGTDHLDGMIGTIVDYGCNCPLDWVVEVDGSEWYIWTMNMELVS